MLEVVADSEYNSHHLLGQNHFSLICHFPDPSSQRGRTCVSLADELNPDNPLRKACESAWVDHPRSSSKLPDCLDISGCFAVALRAYNYVWRRKTNPQILPLFCLVRFGLSVVLILWFWSNIRRLPVLETLSLSEDSLFTLNCHLFGSSFFVIIWEVRVIFANSPSLFSWVQIHLILWFVRVINLIGVLFLSKRDLVWIILTLEILYQFIFDIVCWENDCFYFILW